MWCSYKSLVSGALRFGQEMLSFITERRDHSGALYKRHLPPRQRHRDVGGKRKRKENITKTTNPTQRKKRTQTIVMKEKKDTDEAMRTSNNNPQPPHFLRGKEPGNSDKKTQTFSPDIRFRITKHHAYALANIYSFFSPSGPGGGCSPLGGSCCCCSLRARCILSNRFNDAVWTASVWAFSCSAVIVLSPD